MYETSMCILHIFHILWRNSLPQAKAASLLKFLDHTPKLRASRTPLITRSARSRNLYLQITLQWTNIHALSGIRNGDPCGQEAVDLYLTQRGHRDRLQTV